MANDTAYSRWIYKKIRQKIFAANDSYISSATLTSANFEGDWIDVDEYQSGSFHLSWSGLDAVNAKACIQASLDQSTINVMGGNEGSRTLDVSTGAQIWEITDLQTRYIRLKVFSGSVTDGILNAKTEFRSHGI